MEEVGQSRPGWVHYRPCGPDGPLHASLLPQSRTPVIARHLAVPLLPGVVQGLLL
jgi:hypothetical protein